MLWIDKFIGVAEKVIPSELCKDIIQRFEDDKQNYKEVNDKFKKITSLYISGQQEWKDVDTKIFDIINPVIKEYREKWSGMKSFELNDSGYIINAYEQNAGFYDWHINSSHKDGSLAVMIMYLNDVENGGETEFKHQNLFVKPVEGNILIMPSSWTFENKANIPKSNKKYSITTHIKRV